MRLVPGAVLAKQALQDPDLLTRWRPQERALVGPANARLEGRAALPQDAGGEDAGRLHVGRVVEQDEGLLGDVRAGALGHALFARGGVEGELAGLGEGALPPGVDP